MVSPVADNVSSLLPRVLNFVYSDVANKEVAFSPRAKNAARSKTPVFLKNSFPLLLDYRLSQDVHEHLNR